MAVGSPAATMGWCVAGFAREGNCGHGILTGKDRPASARGQIPPAQRVVSDPERACLPSALNATARTPPVCPWKTWRQTLLFASHQRTGWSSDPESACHPSAPSLSAVTSPLCPRKNVVASPPVQVPPAKGAVKTTHRWCVRGPCHADRIHAAIVSLEDVEANTSFQVPVCSVLSSDPERACLSSVLQATAFTPPVCPWRICLCAHRQRIHVVGLFLEDPAKPPRSCSTSEACNHASRRGRADRPRSNATAVTPSLYLPRRSTTRQQTP